MLKLGGFFNKKKLKDLIFLIMVFLISLLSFALGFVTAKNQEREPLRIEESSGELSVDF